MLIKIKKTENNIQLIHNDHEISMCKEDMGRLMHEIYTVSTGFKPCSEIEVLEGPADEKITDEMQIVVDFHLIPDGMGLIVWRNNVLISTNVPST